MNQVSVPATRIMAAIANHEYLGREERIGRKTLQASSTRTANISTESRAIEISQTRKVG